MAELHIDKKVQTNEPKLKKTRVVFLETESHLRFLSDAGYKNEAKNYLKTIIENELDYIQYHPWVNQREANVLKFINDSEAYLKSHDPLSLKYADTLYQNTLKNEGLGSELIKAEMDRIFERYNTKLKTQHNCLKDFNDLIKFVFQRT